jgi:hypothetical protein
VGTTQTLEDLDTLSVPTAAGASPIPPEVVSASKDPKRVFGKYVKVKHLGGGGFGVV